MTRYSVTIRGLVMASPEGEILAYTFDRWKDRVLEKMPFDNLEQAVDEGYMIVYAEQTTSAKINDR